MSLRAFSFFRRIWRQISNRRNCFKPATSKSSMSARVRDVFRSKLVGWLLERFAIILSSLTVFIDRFSGKILCEKPIDILVRNLGIQRVRDDGKQCRSTFQLVWYNPRTDESLILCHIESGRTHQIRVHLQYLGYPIIDDNIYNSPAWGPERGKGCQYGKPIGQVGIFIHSTHLVYLVNRRYKIWAQLYPLAKT